MPRPAQEETRTAPLMFPCPAADRPAAPAGTASVDRRDGLRPVAWTRRSTAPIHRYDSGTRVPGHVTEIIRYRSAQRSGGGPPPGTGGYGKRQAPPCGERRAAPAGAGRAQRPAYGSSAISRAFLTARASSRC